MSCPFCHNAQPCQCGAPGDAFNPTRQVHAAKGKAPAIAPAPVLEDAGQMRLRLGKSAYTATRCGICGGPHGNADCPKGAAMPFTYSSGDPDPPTKSRRPGRSAGLSSAAVAKRNLKRRSSATVAKRNLTADIMRDCPPPRAATAGGAPDAD